MMVAQAKDLWALVKYRPQIDPDDFAAAIQYQFRDESLDYRTRLLIRDGVEALRQYWGDDRFRIWLSRSPERHRIELICQEQFERPGFPSLARRLMKKTDPEEIRRYLRDLGVRIQRPLRIDVGGSVALIMPGYLSRGTDDIDVVDEVPAEIRAEHALLHELEGRYGLSLAHFQRHYLPMGWEQRLHFLDSFGQIQVYLVDAVDVFLSKLFSIRSKDLDDLRATAPQLGKDALTLHLKQSCSSMLAAPDLRARAERNWYILYGEPLPTGEEPPR
jgi:hypothetical protein